MAFATAHQCSPSRASLATGLYPHNNGVMGLAHHGFDWELDSSVRHAAAIFGAAGFETHLFGGQHVTQHPERIGFAHLHREAAAAGVEQLLEKAERRLYIEINFEETHRPYPPAGEPPAGLVIPGYLPDGPESIEEMTAVEQTIATMDSAVGRVLAALDNAGRAANALVVFTTDHGLAMPRAKCTLYDPGLEVALIVRWPEGDIGRGVANSGLVSNIDVLPTLLEACGIAIPAHVQGRSLFGAGGGARFRRKTLPSLLRPIARIPTPRRQYTRNFAG